MKRYFYGLLSFLIFQTLLSPTLLFAAEPQNRIKTGQIQNQPLPALKYSQSPINPYQTLIDKAVNEYKAQKISPISLFQQYQSNGDYLNLSRTYSLHYSPRYKLDQNGIPTYLYYDSHQYNPISISQYGLSQYGLWLNGSIEAYDTFIRIADYLVESQDAIGAFRYNFSYSSGRLNVHYEPGWVSAMAQGLALSVLSRAYLLTGDKRYLLTGKKSLSFLLTPKEQKGVKTSLETLNPTWKNKVFFEEYVSTPNNYTLNGYMYTLLGLYDWSQNAPENFDKDLALNNFQSGVESLKLILPMYDVGGFSTYDLFHLTSSNKPYLIPGYHAVHIFLLHALHSITNDPVLKKYEELWTSYVK